MKKKNQPKPIFVIGAARNGTTSLCNELCKIDGVSGVLSKYHYGNCESKVLRHKFYWGDISKYENYLNFIGHLQYSDYFIAANGDVNDILKQKPKCYFEFFLDLMDNHTTKEGNKYWVTKLDDLFFLYPKELEEFKGLLLKRYGPEGFKYIWIKRDLNKSLQSYLFMEGEKADIRNYGINRYFALTLQTLRYNLIYKIAEKHINNIFKIKFEDYIINTKKAITNIPFLNEVELKKDAAIYSLNSSFKSKNKTPNRFNLIDKLFISIGRFLSRTDFGLKVLKNHNKSQTMKDPFYYRGFMHKNFEDQLKEDLKKRKAFDLIDDLNL